MIKFDGHFLEEVGLAGMSERQKEQFLAHIQEQLELRVGEEISKGMTPEQIAEFDGIMNADRETMIRFLAQFPDYQKDDLYRRVVEKHNTHEVTLGILSEYLSVKWIQKNRPNYAEIATAVAEELKAEIAANREQILNS